MIYTHTLELDMNGIDVEAEVSFEDAGKPHIKFASAPELSVEELEAITVLTHKFCDIYHTIGEIRKIELVKKVWEK